jgi:hypothetical protein
LIAIPNRFISRPLSETHTVKTHAVHDDTSNGVDHFDWRVDQESGPRQVLK